MKKVYVSLLSCLCLALFSACSTQFFYKKIQTPEDCACKENSLWYSSKCWKNIEPAGYTFEEIDSVVQANVEKSSSCRIQFDSGENVPVKMFMPFPFEKGDLLLLMVYGDHSENTFTLISRVKEKTMRKEKELDLDATLVKGDLISGNYDTIHKGTGTIHFSGDLEKMEYAGNCSYSYRDSNYRFSFSVNEAVSGMGNSELTIKEDTAYLSGDLGTITYVQINDLIENHPEVKTLVLDQISGSINDEVNVHTGRLVRRAGISTVVLSTSNIASGGVDLFCAGVTRKAEEGAKVGVHSWCCIDDLTAQELPKDHPAHRDQLDYFTEMMGEIDGPAFYFYTLQAAPFDDVYWMSMEELKANKVLTGQ